MTKAHKFRDITKEIRKDPARNARIEAHKQAIYKSLELAELRRTRQITQVEMAKLLDVSQSSVSQLERRSQQEDVYISTLRRYVEELGGKLEIQAVFDDQTVTIAHLIDKQKHQAPPTN